VPLHDHRAQLEYSRAGRDTLREVEELPHHAADLSQQGEASGR
jgi:hypothetical protein